MTNLYRTKSFDKSSKFNSMKKIGILGTGVVGQTLAGKLAGNGYAVMLGTRNIDQTLSRNEKDSFGRPPFREWHKQNPQVKLGSFAEAAAFGELIINATNGQGSLEALRLAKKDNLAGKTLFDISNPLDFSNGMPPTLTVCNHDSLAEQIQREFPQANVVKSLNTINAWVMVNPAMVPGDHNVFISGNVNAAKDEVKSLLTGLNWKPENIIDLGDISTSRGPEMILPLWVSLLNTLQNPSFNFHISVGSPPAM
jgi:predicted dinucleotide-binding enzyme